MKINHNTVPWAAMAAALTMATPIVAICALAAFALTLAFATYVVHKTNGTTALKDVAMLTEATAGLLTFRFRK